MKQRRQREFGFGHIGLLLGFATTLAVSSAVVMVWHTQHNQPVVSPALKTALANADCTNQTDADLCKFLIAYAAQPYTTVSFTKGGNSGTYQTNNASDYHLAIQKPGSTYEIIGLDTALYSKNADGSWWKAQVPRSELSKYNSGPGVGLTFPASASGVSYRKQDGSPCQTHAALTCLQYQITDASAMGTARFIWFDTTNYQLQRYKSVDMSGVTDATFGYAKAVIKRPSPAKNLPGNKYLVPGQQDPVTLPAGASWDSSASGLIDQYQQDW